MYAFAHKQRNAAPSSRPAMVRKVGMLQRKLKVGATNDPAEREADRMADQVMRMPAPKSPLVQPSFGAALRSKCTSCEEKVQRNADDGAEASFGAPPAVHNALRSPGRPLDADMRAFFEPRFGRDFGDVRVHTGRDAAASAEAIDAAAYTAGRDIVFGANRYAPGTQEGHRLIAHELAHVQQGDARTVRRDLLPSFRKADSGIRYSQCFAPGGFFPFPKVSEFGDYAHRIIELDFCKQEGCMPGVLDYFDARNPTLYRNFLAVHGKREPATIPLFQQRPDIMSFVGERREFYEIKPDSSSGQSEGKAKINNISAYLRVLKINNRPGTAYTPTESIQLVTVPVVGGDVVVTLKTRRSEPGLPLYQICIDSPIPVLEVLKVIAAAIITFILALIMKGAKAPEMGIEPVPVTVAEAGGSGGHGAEPKKG